MPISLPNAVVGSVVTRFPPEPSWMLDLGHCKASLMNQYIATQFKVPPSAVQACHRVL
jgi:glutamyl-tRNA synthetase